MPLNFPSAGKEMPVGLALVTAMLFTLAGVNVLTKKVATISGLSFTGAFFLMFELSDRYNKKRNAASVHSTAHVREEFRLQTVDEVTSDTLRVRPGNIMVAVRNPHHLEHLQKVLSKTDIRRQDIVVITVKIVTQAGSGEHEIEPDQVFADQRKLRVLTRGDPGRESRESTWNCWPCPASIPGSRWFRPRLCWKPRAW